jgi:acyl-CoA dehydrogenase
MRGVGLSRPPTTTHWRDTQRQAGGEFRMRGQGPMLDAMLWSDAGTRAATACPCSARDIAMSRWGDVSCTQAFRPVRRPRAPRPCDRRGAPHGGQRVGRDRVRGCLAVIALRANSADTALCGPLACVLAIELGGIGPGPFGSMLAADLRPDVVRIGRPVGDEEVFSGDPRAAVMAARGKRSIALNVKNLAEVDVVKSLGDRADVLTDPCRPRGRAAPNGRAGRAADAAAQPGRRFRRRRACSLRSASRPRCTSGSGPGAPGNRRRDASYAAWRTDVQRTIFEDVHADFRDSVRPFLLKEAAPHTAEWESSGTVDRALWKKTAGQGPLAFAAPEELGGAGLDDFSATRCSTTRLHTRERSAITSICSTTSLRCICLELTIPELRRRLLPGATSGDPHMRRRDVRAGPRIGPPWRADRSGSARRPLCAERIDIVRDQRDRGGSCNRRLVHQGRSQRRRPWALRRGGEHAWVYAGPKARERRSPASGHRRAILRRGLRDCRKRARGGRQGPSLPDAESRPRDGFLRRGRASASDHAQSRAHLECVRQADWLLPSEPVCTRRLATGSSVARVFVDRSIGAHNAGELSDAEAAGAKFWSTELPFRVIDRCLQLHGGYPYMEEYEIAHIWRDARATRTYGGTAEITKEIVGGSLGLARG